MNANETQPPSPSPPPGDGWFIARGETCDGPMTLAALNSLVLLNEVRPGTLVWRAGMAKWSAAVNVDEIRAMFLSLTPLVAGPGGAVRFARARQMPESAVSVRAHAAFWLGVGSFVPGLGVAAIFFGLSALRSIKKTPGQAGKRRAIIGIVLGALSTAAFATLAVVLLARGTSGQ